MTSLAMLLAQRDRWERLGDQFSGRNAEIHPGEIAVILGSLAAAALGIWLLYAVSRWQEGKMGRPRPGRLFRDLCRTHRLNRWERAVVRSAAEAAGARQLAEAFVRPEMFHQAPPAAQEKPAAYNQLRRKLFPELG